MKPRLNTDGHGLDWERITSQVIGCAFNVANALGAGFLEEVCENALVHELRKAGMNFEQQSPIAIRYDGVIVGKYDADLLVERKVIGELKPCRATDDIHFALCMNYLKATSLPVCLLINFGPPRIQIRRILNRAVPEAWVCPADEASLNIDT